MNNIGTVIRFTYRNKVKSRPFLISTIILALIISIAINMPYLIAHLSSHAPTRVGIVQSESNIPSLLKKYFRIQKSSNVSVVIFPARQSVAADESMLNKAVASGKIQGYVELNQVKGAAFPQVTYKSKQSIISSQDFASQLQQAFQLIKTQVVVKQIGLSSQQMGELYSPVSIQTVQLSASSTNEKGKTQAMVIMAMVMVYALLFLLFMGVTMTGSMIANEVTAEKSSRVMEILISSVSPLQQMFGKIIGIGLVGLTQIVIFIVIALINVNLPQNTHFLLTQFHLSFRNVPVSLLIYFVFFYIAGYFLFATLFAAIGSLVSRTEDLGQAILPATFLLLAGFYIGVYGLQAPNSPFVVAMSFIPFFTPLIMFLRIGLSDPSVWQVILSIVILLASVYGMTWLSAKIYRTGVLMYGKRPSIRELRRAMRAMKM